MGAAGSVFHSKPFLKAENLFAQTTDNESLADLLCSPDCFNVQRFQGGGREFETHRIHGLKFDFPAAGLFCLAATGRVSM